MGQGYFLLGPPVVMHYTAAEFCLFLYGQTVGLNQEHFFTLYR